MADDLVVLGTGGTIDKDYPRATGGYAFEIDEPAAERVLGALPLSIAVRTQSVCKKDSQELTDADRARLVKALRATTASRVVITHGTDTLIETAQYIARDSAAVGPKVVALTGAKKPEVFKDSDAAFNIGVAVGATVCARPLESAHPVARAAPRDTWVLSRASQAALPAGSVVVCMSGRVIDAMRCTRDPETGYFVEKSAASSTAASTKRRRR